MCECVDGGCDESGGKWCGGGGGIGGIGKWYDGEVVVLNVVWVVLWLYVGLGVV